MVEKREKTLLADLSDIDSRMAELDQKSASINSVKQAQTAIHELLEYFKKTPVSEALGTVKKGNVKTKKKFNTSDYRIEDKAGRKFAVTKSQDGPHECWRVVSKDFAAANGG